MKTYSAKPKEVEAQWVLFDAQDLVLGRLAAEIATRLRGKHRPQYTPHIDTGDNVIVINAEKIHITGRKRDREIMYRHTGYPGGIKQTTRGEILEGKYPERVLMKAVERMMPKNKLARTQLKKLRIYAGETHPHEAQTIQTIDFAQQNEKNAKRGR